MFVGFQNDYFAPNGILHAVVEESSRITGTLDNTLALLRALVSTPVLLIDTPIVFTENYEELHEPVGILKHIADVGAFRRGSPGCATIEQFREFSDRLHHVPGKRGLNAFSNTRLDEVLQERGIDNVVLAGAVTSICIDSTARSAHERGYRVTVLRDCTSARTPFEQNYYCQEVFPLYATVATHTQVLADLGVAST